MTVRIYRLNADTENFSSFLQKYESDEDIYERSIQGLAMHQEWRPFEESYRPVTFELRSSDTGKRNYQFDISASTRPFYVLSEAAAEALKDILAPRGQFLPIQTPSKRKAFVGYYPTHALDGVIDLEKSNYRVAERGLIFNKICLFADKVKDEYLFAPRESYHVFITDRFRERVEAAGLKGFEFGRTMATS